MLPLAAATEDPVDATLNVAPDASADVAHVTRMRRAGHEMLAPVPRRSFPRQPGDFRPVGREAGGIIFKLIGLMALALILCALYLVRYPLLRAAGHVLIVDEAPEQADAIVVLGDNYRSERTERAAELFRAGWARRVVASGHMLRPYSSVAELMHHDLRLDNVPEGAIVVASHSALNTREEVTGLSQLFRQQGWRKILFVTSNYHSRRTDYICRRVLPMGTEFRVIAAPDSLYDPDSWWKTPAGLKLFSHETAGMIEAWWELRRVPVAATDEWTMIFRPRVIVSGRIRKYVREGT
jgi:uncharacterized SAM-binding protein YcdF (DUF218 family)